MNTSQSEDVEEYCAQGCCVELSLFEVTDWQSMPQEPPPAGQLSIWSLANKQK